MDKSKMVQLKGIIRQVVNEEIEAIMPDLLSEVKKAIDNRVKVLLAEANKSKATITDPPASPSRVSKQMIAEMLGGNFGKEKDTVRVSTQNLITPQSETSSGIKPAEEVVRAITRDYSDLMTKLNQIRPDVKGVYRV